MTTNQFIDAAQAAIRAMGLTPVTVRSKSMPVAYVYSIEAAPGCYGQPQAEAMLMPDGLVWHTDNLKIEVAS